MFLRSILFPVCLSLVLTSSSGESLDLNRLRGTSDPFTYGLYLQREASRCFNEAEAAGLRHPCYIPAFGESWADDYAERVKDYSSAKRAFDAAYDLNIRSYKNGTRSEQENILSWQKRQAEATVRKDIELVERAQSELARAREWLTRHRKLKETVGSILDEGWGNISQLSTQFYEDNPSLLGPKEQFDRALLLLDQGNAYGAVCALERLIESGLAETIVRGNMKTARDFYSNLALAHAECGEFGDAVLCLDKAIRLDPDRKKLYLERAIAHFETGNLPACLDDYLSYAGGEAVSHVLIEPSDVNPFNVVEFGSGIARGMACGATEGVVEFVPTLLASAHGLSQGLWALVVSPIQTTTEFCEAATACIEVIRQSSPEQLAEMIAPELADLAIHWEALSSDERGYRTGAIIGKYGVDIFAGAACIKGVKAYRELRRANAVLTLETLTKNTAGQRAALIASQSEYVARRKAYMGALRLEPDKQGKHIVGHQFYQSQRNRSIWTHPDPEGMMRRHAGTGQHVRGEFGVPGHKEIVDCGEIIGFFAEENTGARLATTRAQIHYSKQGAHIVPATPSP